MKAVKRVLFGWIIVTLVLVAILFYRYDLIGGIKRTLIDPPKSTDQAASQTPATPEKAEAATPSTSAPMATTASFQGDVVNGKKVYEEKTCVTCHGANGMADSAMAKAIKSTSFVSGVFQNNDKKMEAKAYILNVIENGVPGTPMVSFKEQIPKEQDRKDLAEYVYSFSKKK